VVLGHASAFALAVSLHGFHTGLWLYAFAFGIPASFAAWSMMFTNYVQHVGCDHDSTDNHSRNFTGRAMNWLVFEAGYHTVHHEHPGIHWSAYPALHGWRAARIAPHLNQQTIFRYCFERYLLRRPAERCAGARPPTETDCDTLEFAMKRGNYG
jgi:fatty acid desaturase